MKKILFIILSIVLYFPTIQAQSTYYDGQRITTTDGTTYQLKVNPYRVFFENTKNTIRNSPYVYLDGTPVKNTEEFDEKANFKGYGIYKALNATLTQEEQIRLGQADPVMDIYYAVSNTGRILEIDINFLNKQPIVSILTPNKVAQLEKNFKKYIELTISEDMKKLKFTIAFAPVSFPKNAQEYAERVRLAK